MGGQKSEPINLTTETNQPEPTEPKRTNQPKSQPTQTNRQLG